MPEKTTGEPVKFIPLSMVGSLVNMVVEKIKAWLVTTYLKSIIDRLEKVEADLNPPDEFFTQQFDVINEGIKKIIDERLAKVRQEVYDQLKQELSSSLTILSSEEEAKTIEQARAERDARNKELRDIAPPTPPAPTPTTTVKRTERVVKPDTATPTVKKPRLAPPSI